MPMHMRAHTHTHTLTHTHTHCRYYADIFAELGVTAVVQLRGEGEPRWRLRI